MLPATGYPANATWRSSMKAALLHAHARDAAVRPVAAEHVAIVEAVRLRDPARARAAMRDHLNALLGHLLFATEEQAVVAARHSAATGRVRYLRAAAW